MNIVVILLAMLLTLLPSKADSVADGPDVVVIPPMPQYLPTCQCERCEWDDFYADAYSEYYDEFTALFQSYSYKRARNGRSMINGKFVAMPKKGK